jgi:hypothetical protein
MAIVPTRLRALRSALALPPKSVRPVDRICGVKPCGLA